MKKNQKARIRKEWCPICHSMVNEKEIDNHCETVHKMTLNECLRFSMIKHARFCCDVIPNSEHSFINHMLDDVLKFDNKQRLTFWMALMFGEPLYLALSKGKGL